ncbi:MAG TPA: hypothetical protein VID50_01400 [Candidatus Eisenbacteria bacterium]
MKPLTDQERAGAAAEAKRLAASGPALAELLGQTMPRLLEELGASRSEIQSLRAALEKQKEQAARDKSAPSSSRPVRTRAEEQEAEAAGALMAAPFRVSAKAASAARTEPLAALAVQVAKALSPDANPVERARLIAMAFAASQGDLEAFWSARRQRKTAAKPNRGTALREKKA